MFRIIICLLAFTAAFNLTAQSDSSHRPHKGKLSKEERQELKKMKKDLNLSEDQKAALKEIYQKNKATKEARKSMTKEQRREAHKATRSQVDSVLNSDQDAKLKQIRKKRKEFQKN